MNNKRIDLSGSKSVLRRKNVQRQAQIERLEAEVQDLGHYLDLAQNRCRELEGANCIRVWAYRDAPQHLQDVVSTNGDEDWLALVPAELASEWPWLPQWLEEPWFGNRVHRAELEDGRVVLVSCHA